MCMSYYALLEHFSRVFPIKQPEKVRDLLFSPRFMSEVWPYPPISTCKYYYALSTYMYNVYTRGTYM